jgi:hypothetical protein
MDNMTAAYIGKIETVNTGGGCMVDIITLWDGRVIGLNDECCVFYNDMDEFWDCSSANKPSFSIPTKGETT